VSAYFLRQEQAIPGSAVAAAARSVRRATARHASNRRATARSRQGDRAQEEADAIADQIALEPAGERDQVTPSAWLVEGIERGAKPRHHTSTPGRRHVRHPGGAH
jgi:hypothetical protein